MIRLNLRTLASVRWLPFAGILAIGLLATTAVPAFAGGSGTWTTTGSMNTARGGHTATLLPNGQVLVAGGANSTEYLASAELYDPGSGKWTFTSSMTMSRQGHTATLLPDGQVLAAGDETETSNGKFADVASAELYTP